MKIWVDDVREPPEGYKWWIKTSETAIAVLERMERYHPHLLQYTDWSLDHDLGGDDTARAIVLWWCEHDKWPRSVVVHSANPPGAYWLESMIERYHPSNAHKYTR